MNDSLDQMYREVILDHFRAPRGKKDISRADISSDGMNPSCGDEIEIKVQVEDGILMDIQVDCRGCAISVASGSMLAESVKGKSIEEVQKVANMIREMLKGNSEEIPIEYEDLDSLRGVKNFPVRIKCALLAWITLLEGLKNYKPGIIGDKTTVSTEESE